MLSGDHGAANVDADSLQKARADVQKAEYRALLWPGDGVFLRRRSFQRLQQAFSQGLHGGMQAGRMLTNYTAWESEFQHGSTGHTR